MSSSTCPIFDDEPLFWTSFACSSRPFIRVVSVSERESWWLFHTLGIQRSRVHTHGGRTCRNW